jgi:hypothetical protein
MPHSVESRTSGRARAVNPSNTYRASDRSTKIPAKATTPATTAATTARRLKYSIIESSASRRASQMR